MKQTAVEWLEEQMKDDRFLAAFEDEFKQAKELEKKQIIDAYHINPLESKWKNIGEQYYSETYKK